MQPLCTPASTGGSAMNSSETAHTHFRIDIASTPGYLTA